MARGLPILRTARLVLRGPTDRDVDDLFKVFSDRDVMRYWSTPAYSDRKQAADLVREIGERADEGDLLQWAIEHAGDARAIGTCTLAGIDRENGRAEIGFILGRADHGHGYAREAVTAVLDHGFDAIGLRRVEADVDPRNAASIRLLERLGFAREGLLRERWCVAGEVADSALYGLLRRDWRTEASHAGARRPSVSVRFADDENDVRRCHRVLRQLRPHLNEDACVEQVLRQRGRDGYRLVFAERGDRVVGVAGYRVTECLAWGRFLDVDDLVTDEGERSTGVGAALLGWIESRARQEGCAQVHLDSGVQRSGAHRFYLRHGMDITSHHFARDLGHESSEPER